MLFGAGLFEAPSFDAVAVTIIIIVLAMEGAARAVKKVDKDGEATEAARQGIIGWTIRKIRGK